MVDAGGDGLTPDDIAYVVELGVRTPDASELILEVEREAQSIHALRPLGANNRLILTTQLVVRVRTSERRLDIGNVHARRHLDFSTDPCPMRDLLGGTTAHGLCDGLRLLEQLVGDSGRCGQVWLPSRSVE